LTLPTDKIRNFGCHSKNRKIARLTDRHHPTISVRKYCKTKLQLEMWANAQPYGRLAEYMWRSLFNAAKFG